MTVLIDSGCGDKCKFERVNDDDAIRILHDTLLGLGESLLSVSCTTRPRIG